MTHIPNIEDCPRTTWADDKDDPHARAEVRIIAKHHNGYIAAYQYPLLRSNWTAFQVDLKGKHYPDENGVDSMAIIIPSEVANA
jgi:hypothetical protein